MTGFSSAHDKAQKSSMDHTRIHLHADRKYMLHFQNISLKSIKDMIIIIDTLKTRVGGKPVQTPSDDQASPSHSDGRHSNKLPPN